MNLQWALLPHKEVPLIDPVTRVIINHKVEVEDDQSEDQTHLTICKAGAKLASLFFQVLTL
jgi:hypothetical protein